MENFDQKPIFRCLICNGHFGTLEENEYGLWGHIIDPEEAEQAARAAEQNGMQSGSNTEMSPFYYGGTTFSECFRDFLDTVEDYNFVHDHLDDPYDEDDYDDYDEEEEDFFPEIVDPNTLQPVEPGQVGELVFTTLTKEGMPMLRYRTRDLTSLTYEKCACGRTAVRMGRILGRSDDMLIIRGVNVFPSQVESVILELPEFEAHYLIVVDRMNNTDTFQIQVEVRQEYYSDEMNKMIALKKKIAARMQSVIGLQPDIKIVEPRSIERSMGKAKHVIDKRKLV